VELSQQSLLMNFLRTKAMFAGGPGSAKSNALLSVAKYPTPAATLSCGTSTSVPRAPDLNPSPTRSRAGPPARTPSGNC
jgi:hypothetical protein